MSILELTGMHKTYGAVTAVDGVSLSVAAASRTAIVGPSGSGKTTLLRLIAGFERPDAGRITLDDRTIADQASSVPAYQRQIGLVAQDGALFPHLSVADNIGFGLSGGAGQNQVRIRELLDMVGLDPAMLARKPDQLSGGQQQRVALARALARKPRLMLLDEPFSALDTGLRAATRKAVTQLLGEAGVTTILVTHDQAEALAFADQVAIMRNGRLVQVGAPQDVYMRPVDAATASFLGEAIILDAHLSDGRATCALGDVEVDDRIWRGPAQIMLRPEQIAVSRIDAAAISPGSVTGAVQDLEFCGATCEASITLDGGHPTVLRIPVSSLDLLSPGERVQLHISRTAHRLGQ
jgi:iron(III) transport system ATP-binding protein